jgi:hypothetical protein
MSEAILSVVLKVVGAIASAVAGAVVLAFKDDILHMFINKMQVNDDLQGCWLCTWNVDNVDNGASEPICYNDKVNLIRVRGEKFQAEGITTEFGNYNIEGRISKANLVTLHYGGVESRQALGGVAILIISATRLVMKGAWYEYGEGERIVRGTTKWEKKRS